MADKTGQRYEQSDALHELCFLGALMKHGVPAHDSGRLQTRASSRTRWTLVSTVYVYVCVRVCERSRERALRRILGAMLLSE